MNWLKSWNRLRGHAILGIQVRPVFSKPGYFLLIHVTQGFGELPTYFSKEDIMINHPTPEISVSQTILIRVLIC